jgi:inosose dehydratase
VALHQLKLATGPVSFGVDFAKAPSNPPWPYVLDQIARSPLQALELGPVGYLPEDPGALRHALESRSLTAVGSFVFEDLHTPALAAAILETALRACRAINAAEGSILVIIDRPGPDRAATAGRRDDAVRLSPDRWRDMLDLINRLADLARAHDLRPAFHPHAGSYVEFPDEIERLAGDTDVDLCLDTGHLAYAGIPAHEAITTYASRLAHLHLKDIDPWVLDGVRHERLDFWAAITCGVFCPLGRGQVDLTMLAAALSENGYSGFATIEQDRVPGSGRPLEDLRTSLDVLWREGIGSVNPTRAKT